MKLKLLIITLVLLSGYAAHAQLIKSKLDIVGGISAREYFHGGLRYQYSEITQIGFYLGNNFNIHPNENNTSYCFDHMVHFGNKSIKTKRAQWYARQGYTLLKSRTDEDDVNYSYINLSLGREVGFAEWFGANIDFGAIWQVREYQVDPYTLTPIDNRSKLYALARLQFFISF